MPSFVNVNGSITRRPGVIASVDFSANSGRNARVKRLAVIGDFPFLEQHEPYLVTSQASLLKLAPNDANLKRLAAMVYRPGNDTRIGSGPSALWLVSAATSTQASYTAEDDDSVATLTFDSKMWGNGGNRTRVALVISSGLYTFTITRDGRTETIGNLRANTLFALDYAGNDFTGANAGVTVGFDGNFTITATKSAIALGSLALGCAWDGVVSITPSVEPTDGTYTAVVTGTNKVTGVTGDTETITMDPANLLPGRLSVKEFSYITSIVFANVGDVGTPTFTLDGDMVDVDDTVFPYVGQLVTFLQTLTSDFTVSSVSSLASGVRLDDMDSKTTTDLEGNPSFTDLVTRMVAALGKSSLVDVTYESGGLPVAFDTFLSAGTPASQSAPTSGDWNDSMTALRNLQPQPATHIALLTDDDTAQTDLAAHCGYMWGPGKAEVQGWTGAGVDETKANIKIATMALNDYRVGYVPQEAKVTRVDGIQEWVPGYWYALMHAAAQCSVGIAVPLTHKRLNVLDVRNNADWDVEDDCEEMLAAACTLTTKGPQGLWIERSLSTHQSDDDAARTSMSAVESIAFYIGRVRARLDPLIGDPAVATTAGRIEGLVDTESRAAVRDGDISIYDSSSLTVEQEGDKFLVGCAMAPTYEIDFIVFEPTVLPVSISL